MFSRSSVIKRVCKFLLKKKLGEVILGDIDLDQLDVQLSTGTIHLSDLALNVDFLNEKITGAPIVVKEGSIKSLSIKIPWKLRNCEIEIDEVEFVLEPFKGSSVAQSDAVSSKSHDHQQFVTANHDNIVHGTAQDHHDSIPLDVHEGVKTIAKVVKWFLTSFHVRVNGVIVAFDPHLQLDGGRDRSYELLVLRIKETEFGTCVSEDSLAKLTNFVKFQEANVEFLQMDDIEEGLELDGLTGKSLNERFGSHGATSVLTGANGGFSGTLNLSIPWKNGFLDISKVDADVSIDPIKLMLQPSSIKWAIDTWYSLKNIRASECARYPKATDSFNLTSRSDHHAAMTSTIYFDCDADTLMEASEPSSFLSAIAPETVPDALLMRANFIHDWVPQYVHQGYSSNMVQDLGVSIDQFFECFDEIRSSEVYSGTRSIWNWTYSVFNAISVASNLASGMGDVPKEKPVKTSLRAAIAGVSVIVFLGDDYQHYSCGSHDFFEPLLNELVSGCSSCQSSSNDVNPVVKKMHHIKVKCQNVVLELETYSQNTKFGASVEHIIVDAYYNASSYATEFPTGGYCNASNEQMFLSQCLKQKIQDALPPFPFRISNCDSDLTVEECSLDSLDQVRLLESFGNCSCKLNINSKDSNGLLMASTSFVIHLPPFIFWFHYNLVDTLLDLFKQLNCSKVSNLTEDVQLCQKNTISTSEVAEHGMSPVITSASPRAFLQGNIILPQARIIICFPSEYYGDFSTGNLLDKLIVLEHFTPLNTSSKVNSARDQSSMSSTSIHLSMQNLDVYLVKSSKENGSDGEINTPDRLIFSASKIISVCGIKKDSCSGVTMLWQQGPVTGSWMVDRTWSLAASHDQNINIIGKGSEFSSATNVGGLEEMHNNIKNELILSSALFLHIEFRCAWVNLENHDYRLLTCLLNHVIDGCSKAAMGMNTDADNDIKRMAASSSDVLQTSLLVNCDIVDACIRLNESIEVSHLLQKELQGSWNCFKLKIDQFEFLSVSNIGGYADANFLWINHREGELWGSISNNNKRPYNAMQDEKSSITHDLRLITCMNSAIRRGNGEGTNALAFGPSGTAITNIWNPLLQQSYTSIVVRCGTIIGPGGRLDWIRSLWSYFSSSDGEKENKDADGTENKVLFFLDLVDVALGYEPYNAVFTFGTGDSLEPCTEKSNALTACVLAASSFSLSKHINPDLTSNYSMHLKDAGFLICESTGSALDVDGYSAGYLQRARYSKVAQASLMQAILRIKGISWELEFAESLVNLESCQDSTSAFIHLIAQLQQLYTPDIEDSLMHLQSRWNTTHQEDNDENKSGMNIVSSNSLCSSTSEAHQTSGLLDDIIDNALECNLTSDLCCTSAHGLLDKCKLNVIASVAASDKPIMPQLIESYCVSNHYPTESGKCTMDISTHRDVEYGQGGWYTGEGLMIVEDHISTSSNQPDGKYLLQGEFGLEIRCIADCGLPKGRVILKNMEARWRMYGGFDWARSKGVLTHTATLNGRDKNTVLELSLVGLSLQYDIYPEEETNVSKLSLSIQDFYLYDSSSNAPWKMVLGNYHSKDRPRESYAKAFKLDLETVRPDPITPLEDYRLHLEILPLRLHLDQTQLNFITTFFGMDSFDDPSAVSFNNLDGSDTSATIISRFGSQTMVEEALLPFFQKCVIKPLVVRVDYIPCHFDLAALRRGNYAELLNLVPWKGIDLQLKNVCARGVYGWKNVCETVIGEWLEDIAHNQVRELLKGLPPIKSLLAVSSGTKKLVSLPVKSYKKDKKLLKGMQRGAMAFMKSVSIEAVGLGVHLAAGAHDILLQTEYILTSVPAYRPLLDIKRNKASIRSDQPENVQEGIQQAYDSLSDGFSRTTSALLGTPLKAYQRGDGAGSAVATAIRGAPAAAIAPFSASAHAVHCTLLGLKNSMDPEHKKESIEKYTGPSQSSSWK
ncbi:autophagy-related protein 2-like [Curcuma longa]|uniref:autophagy-related protein 2-like n=1 Tax=Curcuma longa TaxID=136217 RepID=UPI003D9E48DE